VAKIIPETMSPNKHNTTDNFLLYCADELRDPDHCMLTLPKITNHRKRCL